MMRPLSLGALALLAACASQDQAINPTSGDAFALEIRHLSGTAAVEAGLAQAQSYCGEHGRLFVMTGSQVGSSSYRMAFRCVAPSNVPPPPVVASAPPPAPAARTPRGRGAAVPQEASSGPALGFAASLPPLDAAAGTAEAWQPATANIPPRITAMTATPLFAPPAGQVLAATTPPPRRMPPPDDTPLVPLPRLEAGGIAPAQVAPGQVAPGQVAPGQVASTQAPPAAQLLPAESAAMAAPPIQPAALPPIQAPSQASSLPVITPGGPLPGFATVVPSPNPLPGAPSSLPPIAGGSARPLPLPGGPSSFSTGTTGFTQGFR